MVNSISSLLFYLYRTLTKVRRDCVQLCIIQPGNQQSLLNGKTYIFVSSPGSMKLAGGNMHPKTLRILCSGCWEVLICWSKYFIYASAKCKMTGKKWQVLCIPDAGNVLWHEAKSVQRYIKKSINWEDSEIKKFHLKAKWVFVLLLSSRLANVFCNFNIMAGVVCWQQVAQLSQRRWQEAVVKEGGKPYLGSLCREFTLFFGEAVESLNVKIGLRMAVYLFITG